MRFAPATFLFLAFMVPAQAHASGAPYSRAREAVGLMALVVDTAVFGVVDFVYIARGRPMPVWVSIMEITIGGMLGPVFVLGQAESTGLKIAAGATALWFIGHGIYDLARYPEYRRQKLRERELERARQRCGIAIEPRQHGALLHVYGTL
jgi:hypothetical protein